MLKDIRLHIHSDEALQTQIEEDFARQIRETHAKNVEAFKRNIPSLSPFIQNLRSKNISTFCNQFGEANLVDLGNGRTVYGFHPQDEIDSQVARFQAQGAYISLVQNTASTAAKTTATVSDDEKDLDFTCFERFEKLAQFSPVPNEIDCLIILGCGLGHHITKLIEQHTIKHIIVYEPEVQYFINSAFACKWYQTLALAKKKSTTLYMQIGKDGRDLIFDISDLLSMFEVAGCYVYKHYNHPIFNPVYNQLLNRSWQQLQSHGFSLTETRQNHLDFYPTWTPSIDLNHYVPVDRKSALFQSNLSSFKKYFKDIYQEFKSYSPQKWVPVIKPIDGSLNILHRDTLTPWYGKDAVEECHKSYANFEKHPNKDGLIFGYNGKKLKHYLHYQFVNKTEDLLSKEKSIGELPNKVESLIMFGLGLGYQLEALFNNREIDKLFLCEPNRDFFFASLFAIDWGAILTKVDDSEGRLYLNIGDDGTNLIRDLINQFYSVGPYILSKTYFYQSYYNSNLANAIGQLREQLQIVILMGEYFDHAFYGIQQTKYGLAKGFPHLLSMPDKQLTNDDKNIPVFLVGNGPSLDHSIDVLKECQDQAILISCGTSLQVLYKHGIKPDFHAEVEQNRATYDWCRRIGGDAFLKDISLVACNGIHPDTCNLFKDVYVAFKEGESSTTSALQVLGAQNYTTLTFAFPTVANFATNLFIRLGFTQLYLFGVDLGFVDSKNHHSKDSGYYKGNGEEQYDYADNNNTSIEVPGNFRKRVYTKHEFKIARSLLEDLLGSSKIDCFNCSDGAMIKGSIPLLLDNVLLVTTRKEKQNCLENIKQQAFQSAKDYQNFETIFHRSFKEKSLHTDLAQFLKNSEKVFESQAEIEDFVETQRKLLFDSYKGGISILFYLLYGSINYANAFFSKLSGSAENSENELEAANTARELWLETLQEVKKRINHDGEKFDVSGSMKEIRELEILKNSPLGKIHYISGGFDESELIKHITTLKYDADVIYSLEHSESNSERINIVTIINHNNYTTVCDALKAFRDASSKTQVYVTIVTDAPDLPNQIKSNIVLNDWHVCFICIPRPMVKTDIDRFSQGKIPFSVHTIFGHVKWLLKALHSANKYQMVIPKLVFINPNQESVAQHTDSMNQIYSEFDHVIDCGSYIAIPKNQDTQDSNLLDGLGNRGSFKTMPLDSSSWLTGEIPETQQAMLIDVAKQFIV